MAKMSKADMIEQIVHLQEQNKNMRKRLTEMEKVVARYKKSPFDQFYCLVRKLRNKFRRMRVHYRKTRPEKLPTVTVIIPTYKNNDYIEACIKSVLKQKYAKGKIQILVSVNGEDKAYADLLREKYASEKSIQVLYCEKQGAAAARNYAKDYITGEYVMYLDDDDYLTPKYIREMVICFSKDVDIVCGRMNDMKENGTIDADTYINKTLNEKQHRAYKSCWKLTPFFSTVALKIYRTSVVKNVFGDMDENVAHTEDTIFWIENIQKITGKVFVCKNTKEAYIRRITANSLSRPNAEQSFRFYVTDRMYLIERFSNLVIGNDADNRYKKFVLAKIDASLQHMYNYYKTLSEKEKEKVRNVVNASDNIFVNKSLFAKVKGIAFCHNFAPSVDASAYVASKRLPQIADYIGEPIAWKVICADMQNAKKDLIWEDLFAKYQYTKKFVTEGRTYFSERAQVHWAEKAYEIAENMKADYIYSRSMWAGSHVAAYKYKQAHPEVKWIAEFSDPLYMGTSNEPRPSSKVYYGDEEYLNTFWKDVEDTVFAYADKIIFTNENQRTYMLACNQQENEKQIIDKSLIWHHPVIRTEYSEMLESKVELDESKINVGYFGTFYANRNAGAILPLLSDENIHVHLFTKITEELEVMEQTYSNLFLHSMVPQFEFLNLAHKMDYCFLNDIQFDGFVNPYLPSKLADYIAADTKIIALINDNSPLSVYEDNHIIKTKDIDEKFVSSLKKVRGNQ